jgi:hypothetical protein
MNHVLKLPISINVYNILKTTYLSIDLKSAWSLFEITFRPWSVKGNFYAKGYDF